MAAAACTVVVVAAVLAAAAAAAAGDVMSDVIKCGADQDASSCLKVTALRLLDSALAADSLRLSDDLSVDRRPGEAGRASTAADLGHNVSSSALDGLLLDRAYQLLSTRTLKFHPRDDTEEARSKKKKKGGIYLAMFGGVGVMLLKLALATLALLAGKALLIAKVALLLSAILGLKHLLQHQPQEKHAPQVIYAEPDVSHASWSRSTQVPEAAHDLAYRGQRSIRSHHHS